MKTLTYEYLITFIFYDLAKSCERNGQRYHHCVKMHVCLNLETGGSLITILGMDL